MQAWFVLKPMREAHRAHTALQPVPAPA